MYTLCKELGLSVKQIYLYGKAMIALLYDMLILFVVNMSMGWGIFNYSLD